MTPGLPLTRAVVLLTVLAGGCATATHGSHTEFAVQTIPPGASVTTDRPLEDGAANASANSEDAGYYGCAPTPCSFRLPRRSDFNILITRPSYQPFTWAVTKMPRKEARKKAEADNLKVASAVSAANMGVALGSSGGGLGPAAVAALGMTSAFVLTAEPVFFSANSVDLASGALIELYPNPLNVRMAKEVSPENTKAIIEAFRHARRVHRQLGY